MRTNQYLADAETIGDWEGNEEQAINLWNAHIAPALIEAHEAVVKADIDYDQRDLDRIGYLDNWAWDEFCGRAAGDSEEETKQLAEEVRAKLA